jgi:hypothetical protein
MPIRLIRIRVSKRGEIVELRPFRDVDCVRFS